jgi:hypothetical protein
MKAFAIASSTRLSFNPIRRSPLMIFTMYLASTAWLLQQLSQEMRFGAGPWRSSDLPEYLLYADEGEN